MTAVMTAAITAEYLVARTVAAKAAMWVAWTAGVKVGEEGSIVGCNVGREEGRVVGKLLGCSDGCVVGRLVGWEEGALLGCVVGCELGCLVDCREGCEEGCLGSLIEVRAILTCL
jgi:hypothetical protein